MGDFWIEPVTLEGHAVRLEPMTRGHVDGLWAVANHKAIWRWMPMAVSTREHVETMVERALEWPAREYGRAFTTVDQASGTVVGATAYLNANAPNRRVEIGWTWITPAFQRSAINTSAKLLMLRHAFEALGCNRVEFKTDSLNTPSRTAIARLGATEEGTFRNHMVRADGTLRHSTYFSIVAQEWPEVERGLLDRLGRYGEPLPTL